MPLGGMSRAPSRIAKIVRFRTSFNGTAGWKPAPRGLTLTILAATRTFAASF
jgi:hypothetical protein